MVVRSFSRYFHLRTVMCRLLEAVMMSRLVAIYAILSLAFWAPSLMSAQESLVRKPARAITCYIVTEEGSSSEGNSLFLRKMGVDPEALKSFAPSRFSRIQGKFSASVLGTFAYEAERPVLLERSGRLALYEVPVQLRSDTPPSAMKTVTVTVSLSDLRKSGGFVQPAFRAMDLAAASLRWMSGTAWIIEMKSSGPGKLSAVVGLTR
jgi:hypothetical protein